jgi:predicted LPLAT superfamily acyltransferase
MAVTPTKTKDWTGRTGGSTFGQKALLFLFHFHSVTVGYAVLALVVPFYMLFARKGYLAIYRYFRHQHGYSGFRAFFKTFKNHFIFGQCMLDRFAIYAGRHNFFKIEITGNEHFNRLLDSDKGFVVAGSHVGNFELSGYLLRQDKKRIYAMIYGDEAREVMNKRMAILDRNNISIVPVTDDLSHIFVLNGALQKGEIVSMPCDRNFGSAKTVNCDFLNGRADFPQGAFALATTLDVPIVTIFVMKETVSKYHIYVNPLSADGFETLAKREKIARLTQSYASELENIVKKYPEQWFNFYNFWN